MSKQIADIVTKLVTLIGDLDVVERGRAIDAALIILGDAPRLAKQSASGSSDEPAGTPGNWPHHSMLQTWMKQHKLSVNQLEQLYHLENGEVRVIASSIAGKTGGEKARNVYLLQGIAGLLRGGEPVFADDEARLLCTNLGCYDPNNHSIYMKPLGNKITGSKSTGWRLTSPGLAAAASLVAEMTVGA